MGIFSFLFGGKKATHVEAVTITPQVKAIADITNLAEETPA